MVCKSATLVAAVAGFLFIGCSPFQRLTKDFSKNQTSISYIYTSPLEEKAKHGSIWVDLPKLTDTQFPPTSVVSRRKNEVVPLLVFNYWRHEYECVLGRQQITESIPNFIQSAFAEETKRTGNFLIEKEQAGTRFTLEIEIDSVGAKGPFVNTGFFAYVFIAYVYQVVEEAGPGIAFSRIHYRVKENERVVLEDYVSQTASFEMLRPTRTNFALFHEHYRSNLAESLSETLKGNVEKLVEHLNLFFEDFPVVQAPEP